MRLSLAWLSCVSLVLLGCGDDDVVDGMDASDLPQDAARDASNGRDGGGADGGVADGGEVLARATIGAAGGELRADAAGIVLVVPSGAVDEATEFRIERASADDLPPYARVITAYRIFPEGVEFAVPLSLRFAVPESERDGTEDLLVLRRRTGGEPWAAISGAEPGAAEVLALSEHFSFFALVQALTEALPACFDLDTCALSCAPGACSGTCDIRGVDQAGGLRCSTVPGGSRDIVRCECIPRAVSLEEVEFYLPDVVMRPMQALFNAASVCEWPCGPGLPTGGAIPCDGDAVFGSTGEIVVVNPDASDVARVMVLGDSTAPAGRVC